MASKNVATVQAIHKAFNDRDWDAIRGAVAQECVFVDGRLISYKGPEAFANDYSKAWADAFSDGKVTDAKYYDAGDTVVTEFLGVGTNDGPLGPMPATNRHLDLPYCEIYHFGPSGEVVGGQAYFDLYGMLVQLGHVEPPPGA